MKILQDRLEEIQAVHPELERRFWLRVKKGEGCWRWTGHIHPTTGYGQYSFRGKGYRATRLCLAIHGKPVPDGLDACHTCDNRWCVNPQHLYAGTRKKNMEDCTLRNRHNKPKGESHWRAKLSADQVKDMRKRRAQGKSLSALAKEFGVNSGTVSRIINRKWRKEVA